MYVNLPLRRKIFFKFKSLEMNKGELVDIIAKNADISKKLL